MPDIIRSFTLPATLTPDRRERLTAALGALQARQHHLANLTSHVASVSEVRIEAEHIELHYRIPGPGTVAVLPDRPDGPTLEKWARQVCETLAAAYPGGQAAVLRHGGLTCDTLAVDEAGNILVLDFGVAECFATALDPAEDHYIRQVAAGVAPEVWAAPNSFGQSTDIFSVGVLLYQLATGQHPHGADPADPDDCKHRILIELPISPAEAGADVPRHVARTILAALNSEPRRRFDTFADMLAALAGTGPDVSDPSRRVTADALQDSELEEHRQRYLEQQQQLRAQRERAEQKWAERKVVLGRFATILRRHWPIASVVAVLLVGALVVAGVMWTGRGNRSAVSRDLNRIAQQANEAFGPAGGEAVSVALGVDEPSKRLIDAFNDLHAAAPAAAFVFDEPQYHGWDCASGMVHLDLGGTRIGFGFERRGEGVELQIYDDLAQKLVDASQTLAIAQMDSAVRDLIGRLRDTFDHATDAADAETRLKDQIATRGPLGYLAYQGHRARCNFGALKPMVGRAAVAADVTLVDDSGQLIMGEITPRVIFEYTCNQARTVCVIGAVRIEPALEPDAHKRWCMMMAIDEAAAALAAGDAARLAQLTTPTRPEDIAGVIGWAGQCDVAQLEVRSLSTTLDRAEVSIDYMPGMLNTTRFSTPAFEIAFDHDHEWRVRTDQHIDWPTVPNELLRQQLGQPLLKTFKAAWDTGDAAAYLGLFPGAQRSIDDVAGMFAQITADEARFEIEPREDPESNTTLYIDIKPINMPSRSGGYVTKTFTFTLRQGELRWDRQQSPLWVFAGRMYDSLVTRISRGPWDHFEQLRSEFEGTSTSDLSPEERDILETWLGGIATARQIFVAASDNYLAGLPERVQLRGRPSMHFRLVRLNSPGQQLFYIQERELAVADIESIWNKSTPWLDWPAVVGQPPAGQVVGLSFDEATAVADRLGCHLPTLAEWHAAASLFDDRADKPGRHAFYGGVWEFCSDPGDASQEALVVGGCWLDYAPDLLAGGLPLPARRSLLMRKDRFGTIGLRLCRRFELPPEAMAYSPAPVN